MENKANLLSKEKTTQQNRVWVRISAACNNKCIFCLDSDAQNGKLIDEDIVKKQIKEGFKEWYENRVIISGWEASINPKFPEYIQYAKDIGYDRVQTVTNGNMFSLENFCKKVFSAWLEEVTFSFHGHNSALHDYLVATPGAFKKSLKWLIYIKKHFPEIIINIDIVVKKINVPYLPEIVRFFMRLGVYEFDILQIIPFGRGFSEYKDMLFYEISDYTKQLQETWEISRMPGVCMWTNRFPSEAFEWYEDLIQDPRKIKSEVMGESEEMFHPFIQTRGKKKPECFGAACDHCFLNQYCHGFIGDTQKKPYETYGEEFHVIRGEEFPSQVYEKYWQTAEEFRQHLKDIWKPLVNIPMCLWGTGKYERYDTGAEEVSLPHYTQEYIMNLYRKKSLRCKKCKYNSSCEWIHLNFIRSYGFKILQAIV